jgi:hypothetical protein
MAAITVSLVIEDFLLDEIEKFRGQQMKYSGHMSKSRAMRILLAKGLEAVEEEAQLKRQAQRRKIRKLAGTAKEE